MAEEFLKSCKEGKAQLHSSGFGGTGFKFDASEDNAIKAYKKVGAPRTARTALDCRAGSREGCMLFSRPHVVCTGQLAVPRLHVLFLAPSRLS